jgi:hypothetical protein
MEIGEITGESEQEPSQEEAPSEEESFLTETPVSDGVLDLALDDLNLEEDEKNLAADVLAEDVETSSDEEPELSLGAETSAAEAEVLHVGSEEQSGESNLTDEIDLTDLGSLLDESDDSARVGKQDELDIELSLDDGSPSKNADDEIELEALEFDLDAENDEKPASKTLKPEPVAEVEMEDEELDLSDIEQMLESDSILETDETESADKPEQLSNLEDELDLNEIEIAVNDSDGSAPEEKAEPEELDLDLDLSLDDEEAKAGEVLDDLDFDLELDEEPQAVEAELAEPDRSPESREDDLLELDLEMDKDEEALNMSDLDTLVVDDHATNVQAKSDTIDTGDIELEFEVDEQAEEEDESGASQTFETSIDEISIDETGSEEFIEETLATATGTDSAIAASTKPYPMKKKKKKTRKFLVFLFILALLGVGGYYGFDYIMKNQIEIPYVSDFINEYLNPKPKDPVGINNLSVLDINSKFVESEQSGRLFIISGKVRNGYSSNRGMIQLQGKLFSKGKVLVMSETTYAGILISDQEFNTTPIAELKQRLNKMPTTRDTGTTVRPGQTLPFMLVFTDLPQDLDEFVIEKVRSQPVP